MSQGKFISIVTVSYNAEKDIEKTIESVVHQTKRELIEYIVIDGLSNDGTCDIIKKFKKQIDQFLSEKDNGIYDAMNKGLRLATADYILFLNAGDYLANLSLIGLLYHEQKNEDILFGETMLYNERGLVLGSRSDLTTRSLPKMLTTSSFKKGLVVSHQSFIPKVSVASPYIDNNLSADIDWIIKCTKNAKSQYHYDKPIAYFLIGGISDQRKIKSLTDRFKVMSNHYGLGQTILLHFYFLGRHILKKLEVNSN